MTDLKKLPSKIIHVTENVLLHPYVSVGIMILFILYGSIFMPTHNPDNFPAWLKNPSPWVLYLIRAVGLTVIAIVLAHDVKVGVMLAVIFVMLYIVLSNEMFKIQVLNFTQDRRIGSNHARVRRGGVEKMTAEEEAAIAAAASSSVQEMMSSIDKLAVEIETLGREKSAMGFLTVDEQNQVQSALEQARLAGSSNMDMPQLQALLTRLVEFRNVLHSITSAPPVPAPAAPAEDKSAEVIAVKLAENGESAASVPSNIQVEATVVSEAPRMGDKLVVEDGNGQPAMSARGEVATSTPVIAMKESGEVAKDELNQEILTAPVQAVDQNGNLAKDAQGNPVVAPVIVKEDAQGNIMKTKSGDVLAQRCRVMCDTSGIWIMKNGVLAPMGYEGFSNNMYAPAL